MIQKLYIHEYGTEIILDTGEDINDATYMAIYVKKPDFSRVTWDATRYNSTSIKYTIQSGDLDQIGRYYIQAYIMTPNWRGTGDIVYIDVYDDFT